jgi:hypothetical protein
MKRELFEKLSAEIARQIKKNGGTEEEILSDFESWRKARGEARFGIEVTRPALQLL